jgi:hypothetical protein
MTVVDDVSLQAAISNFAASATKKLSAVSVAGEREDQIRAPLEGLLSDLAELCGVGRRNLVLVGEASLADLKTRPDYAVQSHNALVGFIEVKAPGKGGDPRKYKDKHDKEQWAKLQSLPNILYTDGNEFSLWRDGELVGKVAALDGDITTGGSAITAAPGLLGTIHDFLSWEPIPPRSPKQLAEVTARVCRLMRDEVAEQLAIGNPALTNLANDWRKLLFPDADDQRFADGYAQAVTFGLLVARARGISLSNGIGPAAHAVGTSTLIGSALFVLTMNTEDHHALKTSLGTLTRVLEVVDWPKISKGRSDSWLYFYEDFLSVYDAQLRRRTGSYYTPPQVVTAMTSLVEDALRTRFDRPEGLASDDVTVVDPAVGTGTFLLAAIRAIAATVERDQGAGAVTGRIEDALTRLIGFEIQLGPYAVAQLRLLAELADLGVAPSSELRTFVTDTLANPYLEEEHLGSLYEPIAESRRRANEIKKNQPVLVVIGNPPYREKAKGKGGWIEAGNPGAGVPAPLADWMPPADWGVGAHAKHLRNLYVYFWRWATWKVFDHHTDRDTGIVCFITVAGFLNGPGFQRMRDYLRRTADELWVIDCSPEGHQPEVNTRVFQDVQQPVCIVLASRSATTDRHTPSAVHYRSLTPGHRNAKFEELAQVGLDSGGWTDCPVGWREPFLPASTGAWSTFPQLSDFFVYDGSGVMPGRTWVIAPDRATLERRWDRLVAASADEQELLFQPHQGGDRSSTKVLKAGLAGHPAELTPVAQSSASVVPPTRYAVRSFDRQWIIPDNRLINRPNPGIWAAQSGKQIYLTAPHRTAPKAGPAATLSALIPDLDHYNGRGGRAIPLWLDDEATVSNIPPNLLAYVGGVLGLPIEGIDLFSYVVGMIVHPAFTTRFAADLLTPGLRVPITADPLLFETVAEVGRHVGWLHTHGERFTDPTTGRSQGPPRLPKERAPTVPADGVIPTVAGRMADSLDYDASKRRLLVGSGFVENVTPAMWAYDVSGMRVLQQWFSYRRANRYRPLIGDKRPPSLLMDIQPDRWLPEYTTDLLNLLNVIGLLIDLEDRQAELLDAVCLGSLVTLKELRDAGALDLPDGYPTNPFRADTRSTPQLSFESPAETSG